MHGTVGREELVEDVGLVEKGPLPEHTVGRLSRTFAQTKDVLYCFSCCEMRPPHRRADASGWRGACVFYCNILFPHPGISCIRMVIFHVLPSLLSVGVLSRQSRSHSVIVAHAVFIGGANTFQLAITIDVHDPIIQMEMFEYFPRVGKAEPVFHHSADSSLPLILFCADNDLDFTISVKVNGLDLHMALLVYLKGEAFEKEAAVVRAGESHHRRDHYG